MRVQWMRGSKWIDWEAAFQRMVKQFKDETMNCKAQAKPPSTLRYLHDHSHSDASLTAKDNQLHMARYIFHKVRCKNYLDALQSGALTVEQAREMYRRAMEDYDRLIAGAVKGTSNAPNQADIDEGFPV